MNESSGKIFLRIQGFYSEKFIWGCLSLLQKSPSQEKDSGKSRQ